MVVGKQKRQRSLGSVVPPTLHTTCRVKNFKPKNLKCGRGLKRKSQCESIGLTVHRGRPLRSGFSDVRDMERPHARSSDGIVHPAIRAANANIKISRG